MVIIAIIRIRNVFSHEYAEHKMKGYIPNDLSYTNNASPIVEAKSQATKSHLRYKGRTSWCQEALYVE
jgi:hypothetical protein